MSAMLMCCPLGQSGSQGSPLVCRDCDRWSRSSWLKTLHTSNQSGKPSHFHGHRGGLWRWLASELSTITKTAGIVKCKYVFKPTFTLAMTERDKQKRTRKHVLNRNWFPETRSQHLYIGPSGSCHCHGAACNYCPTSLC